MEINFNPGLKVNTGVSQLDARQPTTPPSDNPMSFERTQALEKNLQEAPQIRPETVARANLLVADESYPADEVLDKVAGLLAGSINGQQA